jgi:undecaprenyl-diphosphatase
VLGYKEVVTVIAATVGTAVAAGVAAYLLARRWPRLDPAAPRVDAASPLLHEEVAQHPRLRMLLRREIDPATATGLGVAVCVAALVLLSVGIGALALMAQTHTGLAKWDLSFARWGAEHANDTSTRVMRDISLLGGTTGVLAIATVAGIIEYRRRPNRAIPAILALTVLGQFAIMNVVKAVVNRDRPAISQLTGFSGSSFPSGHATAAAATFAVVGLLAGRGRSRRTRNIIAGIAVALAVLVATSRVMLGVHWLTDVIAGIALGWAWLAVSSIAFGGRLLQFGTPVAAAAAVADNTTPDAVAAFDASDGSPGRRAQPLAP